MDEICILKRGDRLSKRCLSHDTVLFEQLHSGTKKHNDNGKRSKSFHCVSIIYTKRTRVRARRQGRIRRFSCTKDYTLRIFSSNTARLPPYSPTRLEWTRLKNIQLSLMKGSFTLKPSHQDQTLCASIKDL